MDSQKSIIHNSSFRPSSMKKINYLKMLKLKMSQTSFIQKGVLDLENLAMNHKKLFQLISYQCSFPNFSDP